MKLRNAHAIMAKRQTPLATPGEILLQEFLKPLSVTQCRLAKEIGVPQRRIGKIVAGKHSITADTAARLGVFFGMEAESWLNLQAQAQAQAQARGVGRESRGNSAAGGGA